MKSKISSFMNRGGRTSRNGINVKKGNCSIIRIDLKTGNRATNDLTEDTILSHDVDYSTGVELRKKNQRGEGSHCNL
jgi:hypothetical protein